MALSTRNKFLYGLGDFSFSLSATFLAGNFLYFLTGPAGISMALASLIIFVSKTCDYLNDPVVGFISDRTTSSWGRRRPFLLWGAVPFGLAFILLWVIPATDSAVLKALWFVGACIIFDLAASFVYIPYYALTPELSSSYDERTSLTSFRMIFSILGSLTALAIPVNFVDRSGSMRTMGGEFMGMTLAIAAVCIACVWVVFFSTREQVEYVPEQAPRLKDSLKSALKNKVFLMGGIIFLVAWTSLEILMAVIKFYITFVIQKEALSIVFMLVIFGVALLSLPLWNLLVKKTNKRMAFIAGAGILAASLMVMTSFNSQTSVIVIIALCITGGFGAGAIHLVPWAMLPDAVEVDEVSSGQRHEGTYYALISLAQKIATSIAVPLAGMVMSVTGFVENHAVQPDAAVTGIRLVMGLGPAILLVLGMAVAFRYPLDREQHGELVDELENRRRSKKKSGSSVIAQDEVQASPKEEVPHGNP